MKRILTALILATMTFSAVADEGMWLLPLLEKTSGKALSEAGCRLTPDEIYSVNHSSLKDAIVHFGGGCTGEMISSEGLLVTNHHCGRSSIQSLSTDEHNYLMNGYWALSQAEELPVPGLTVTFLVYMEDVTDRMMKAEDKSAVRRDIERDANNSYAYCRATVTSFYNENVYYLIVYKTFRDIRFVGAPPADLGRFGGETDNWEWPRHTADFSMFRIYGDKNGNPIDYAEDNVPYSPERFLKISLAGVKEGDFTMVMGYPGSTQRFQTASQLKQMIEINRIRIDARTVRQDIMWEAISADPSVELKYANKFAGSANGWKKWQGMELAFDNLDIIGREERKEAEFAKWISKDKKRVEKYGNAIGQITAAVDASKEARKDYTLLNEAPARIELVGFASMFSRRLPDDRIAGMYRDYVPELDKKEAVALLKHYRDHAKPIFGLDNLGPGFEDFATLDIDAYVEWLFANSAFVSEESFLAADKNDLLKDPATILSERINRHLEMMSRSISAGQGKLNEGSTAFGAGLLEWQKDSPSYPDANSTMRLTYGHVKPYSPKDAVQYKYYTTVDGLFEKLATGNPDYSIPEAMKALYANREYGRYADADGNLRTCFLTDNDITGGNSGSPVLDADGNLIGLAFDGNWESMSSDVMFEPDLQRCICVDIRYVLFCVDKIGGAQNIINELTFVE